MRKLLLATLVITTSLLLGCGEPEQKAAGETSAKKVNWYHIVWHDP